jgi:signal transduction histidine kinase
VPGGRELNEMLAVVAHELRSPLAGVRALAEFLMMNDARQAPEFDVFVRNLHDEVVRMCGTVNSLLDLSRLSSGTMKWDWEEFALAPICEEAIEPIRNQVDHSRLKLSSSVDPSDLCMHGDASAIRRLLVNLLENARQHTRAGSIDVAVRRLAEETPRLMIEVLDTGDGIEPHIAAKLGRPFMLGSGHLGLQHVAGSGMGLALCRGIAAAHAGHLTVTSRPRGGTCVRVVLRTDLSEPRTSEVPAPLVCEVTK